MVQSILKGPSVCSESGLGPGRQCCTVVIFPSGQHCCYPGGDIVVSHSLLCRPWVTVRSSEALSAPRFLNFIVNAIFINL